MNPKEIFEFFEGKWEVVRHCIEVIPQKPKIEELTILNPSVSSPNSIIATGKSSFTMDQLNTLLYSETIELQDSNWHQKYQYKYDPLENKLHKYFANGDYFYELELKENGATGSHKCVQDYYNSEYLFLNEKEMQITYKIKGPHKNHRIITSYRKIQV